MADSKNFTNVSLKETKNNGNRTITKSHFGTAFAVLKAMNSSSKKNENNENEHVVCFVFDDDLPSQLKDKKVDLRIYGRRKALVSYFKEIGVKSTDSLMKKAITLNNYKDNESFMTLLKESTPEKITLSQGETAAAFDFLHKAVAKQKEHAKQIQKDRKAVGKSSKSPMSKKIETVLSQLDKLRKNGELLDISSILPNGTKTRPAKYTKDGELPRHRVRLSNDKKSREFSVIVDNQDEEIMKTHIKHFRACMEKALNEKKSKKASSDNEEENHEEEEEEEKKESKSKSKKEKVSASEKKPKKRTTSNSGSEEVAENGNDDEEEQDED